MAEHPAPYRGRASSLTNVTNVISVPPESNTDDSLHYKMPAAMAASADNVPRISADPPITSRSDTGVRQRANTHMHLRPRKRSYDIPKVDSKLNLVFPFPMYESFIRDSIASAREDDKSLRSNSELDEGSLDLYSDEDEEGDQERVVDERFGEGIGSLGCIFSLWNTMVGSTIIVLPYGFHEAGPILGAFIAALAAGCSLFTAVSCSPTLITPGRCWHAIYWLTVWLRAANDRPHGSGPNGLWRRLWRGARTVG